MASVEAPPIGYGSIIRHTLIQVIFSVSLDDCLRRYLSHHSYLKFPPMLSNHRVLGLLHEVPGNAMNAE